MKTYPFSTSLPCKNQPSPYQGRILGGILGPRPPRVTKGAPKKEEKGKGKKREKGRKEKKKKKIGNSIRDGRHSGRIQS